MVLTFKRIAFAVGSIAGKLTVVLTVMLASLSSFAFTEAHWSTNGQIDTDKRTYIVVGGEGFEDMGTQFTKSALSQVKKIREYDPTAQVVLYVVTGTDNTPSAGTLQSWAPEATIIPENNDLMTGSKLLSEIMNYSRISALLVYAHSTPTQGVALQGKYERFGPDVRGMSSLRGHFTSDAIVSFFGCNSGYFTAPKLAHMWGIPVSAPLTSTNFQQLHSNGHFYGNDPGTHPGGPWASRNSKSFSKTWGCPDGECVRMKPDNSPYSGVWGRFGAGLGFYKWFCPMPVGSKCAQGMKTGALLWVGPTDLGMAPDRAQVMSFIDDYFCPEDASSSAHQRCATGIDHALQTNNRYYSGFSGTTLNCPFYGCDYTIVGTTINHDTTYVINPVAGTETNTTMMDEVHAYLKAFNLE
jgi:hypothetical protein